MNADVSDKRVFSACAALTGQSKKKEYRINHNRYSFAVYGVKSVAALASAGVTLAVMMVIAMEISSHLKSSVDESLRDLPDISLGSANYPDTCVGKCIDRSAADSAADEGIHLLLREQCGKRAVSGITG